MFLCPKISVPFYHRTQNISISKTVFDVLNERFIELELGSITPNLATSQANISEKVDRTISNYLDIAQENAKSLINHPFNGNIYIDKESGVLYLIDTVRKLPKEM